MNRKGFIGGSDMPIIAGVSRFKSRHTLWLEKTGRIEPEELDLETRKLAEPYIISVMEYKEKIKCIDRNLRYIHPQHDFMQCEVDFTFSDGINIQNGEIKTTNHLWDEVPIDYMVQAQYNLGITGRDHCKLIAMAGWDQYRSYPIERNQALIDELQGLAADFWVLVKTDTPPEPERPEDFDRIDHDGDLIATSRLIDMIADAKELEKCVDRLHNLRDRLKIEIGRHERLIDESGRVLATYKKGRLVIKW